MATVSTGIGEHGFEVVLLQNEFVRLTILPEVGGKILSIEDARTGRDWLWKNADIALSHPRKGLDYGRYLDSGGWDEVLFSVDPFSTVLEGGRRMTIPDHGPAVGLPWRVLRADTLSNGGVCCELEVEDEAPRFRLVRCLKLDAKRPRFELTYRLENTGDVAWPWMWCAHPLLDVKDGMRLIFDTGTTDDPEPLGMVLPGQCGDEWSWPFAQVVPGESIDLSRVFLDPAAPEGFSIKAFVRSTGRVRLRTAEGRECLSMSFDSELLPWMGLWINKRGWSGAGTDPYLNLGLEPATAPTDGLGQAMASGQASQLAPGASASWWLDVALGLDCCHDD